MKRLFLILIFTISFLANSCSSTSPKRKVASELAKPRHIIFLVHGIAAGSETFGHMDEALTKHLNQNSSTDYTVKYFVYETHNNKNDTEQFAKDLGNNINQYFAENGEINPQDKISIIAHSQGGIVSLIWIYRAMMGDEAFYPQYIRHMDSYITLGTPYWGAKIAVFGDNIKKMTEKFNKNFLPFFGSQQLEDMSFGSPVIFQFQKTRRFPSHQQKAGFTGKWQTYLITNYPTMIPLCYRLSPGASPVKLNLLITFLILIIRPSRCIPDIVQCHALHWLLIFPWPLRLYMQ